MKKSCKYCGAKASAGMCSYCQEKIEIITKIKSMLESDK